MRSFIETLSDTIGEIVAATGATHSLSLSDYHLLKTVANNEVLGDLDRKTIQRALYLVRRGRISLIDDLSESLMSAA